VARAKSFERSRARQLRAKGWSLRRIAAELGVALSSVSVWVRDVTCPAAQPVASAHVPDEPESGSVVTRRCSRCRQWLPLTRFNRHGDGHQWWCRECFRANYQRNREHQLAKVNRLKHRRVAEARQWVLSHLRVSACRDCGAEELVLLEFDHVGPKRAEVATLVSRGINLVTLALEIEQCEVVCANCHRRRTAQAFAYAVLEERGCVDCGERDVCVLDFDHVKDKTQSVMRLAWQEVGLKRLQAEIARCEMRCVNCHRRRTAGRAGYYRATAAGA
jgi:hypothetical protein